MNAVVCFSGGIASGKTTLAAAVADRLGLKVATFGGFVRAEAKRRGIVEQRDALQSLGEALIAEMGWEPFCRAVLDAAGWKPGVSIVVDGIRHVAALNAVTTIAAPLPTKLVLVQVPQAVRQLRADEGRPDEGTNLVKADVHSTEKDVHGALHDLASVVLNGTLEPETLVTQVLEVLIPTTTGS